MNPTANTYTSPAGTTQQANQLQAGQDLLANIQGVNQPTTSSVATDAGANLAAMSTPEYKSKFIENQTAIPQMSQNFNDLVSQLAQADVTHFGYNPMPSWMGKQLPGGLPLSPYTGWELPALSADNPVVPAGTAPDPFAAMNLKLEQGKNMVDLLDTLNTAIGREFSTKSGVYASKIAAATIPLKVALQLQQNQIQENKTFTDSVSTVMGLMQSGVYENADQAINSLAGIFPNKSRAQIEEAMGHPTDATVAQFKRNAFNKMITREPLQLANPILQAIADKVGLAQYRNLNTGQTTRDPAEVEKWYSEAFPTAGTSGETPTGSQPIKVRDIYTGMTGTMPASSFDPLRYQKI